MRKFERETWTYYVLPETFREDLAADDDSKALIKVLDEPGLLIRDKSEGKPAGNVRLPGVGMTSCYRIRPVGKKID